jgi:ribonuclease D
MSWTMIESDEALLQLLETYRDSPAVAVDTEFMRRNTFYPQVALLQLCFDDKAWLVDPLKINTLGPLRELLTNPDTVKVLHSASEDLEVFQHWLGVLPQPMFDSQRASALLNIGFGLGYRAMVEKMCGENLPKGETRSDWLQRPLTESQCHYAAQDVTFLLPIYHTLQQQCVDAGKLDWVLADGAAACDGLASGNRGYYHKIKSGWKLAPRELAGLIAISDWREQEARERDKPRSWIIDDKACLVLAQALPGSSDDMRGLELPSPAIRRYQETWLELLEEVLDCPQDELPASLPGPLDAQQRNRLKTLKSAARSIAEQLEVAPEVLLPAKDFELLLRESVGETINTPSLWRGWRQDRVIAPLRAALSGE